MVQVGVRVRDRDRVRDRVRVWVWANSVEGPGHGSIWQHPAPSVSFFMRTLLCLWISSATSLKEVASEKL